MSVRININETGIAAKIDQAWERGRQMLSSEILRDCNRYCKEDTGILIASSLTHSDLKQGKLVWQTPYAARQYYEIRTAFKDVNSNASWRWVEVAKNLHAQDWERKAQAIVRYYR